LAASTVTVRRPGSLPAEVTGFVGRQRELAELSGLLWSARLVTVTGPGGVGKTRVALRCAAAEVAARFAHGVCLAELSALRDPELLPHTVATALGLPENDGRPELDAVIGYLRDRELLLVLDTCEHLVDASAILAEVLLRAAPGVRVLATSRQPLDVPGEHTRAIAPLPLGQLSERLEDRFRLLSGGRRATLPHHQTLRTATEWSYDLCTPAEQLLWARLSVFAGAFDLAAAEKVCAGGGLARADVLAALVGLVDKSVVLRVAGLTRYRLLDTIREFGAGKLAAYGAAAVRERHIARYARLAGYSGLHPLGEDQLGRFRQLRAEHDDLRAALDYALTVPGHDGDAALIATSLFGYWQLSARLREGGYWLGKVLGRFPGPSAERARALIVHGNLAILRGEAGPAEVTVREAIRIGAETGDRTITSLGCMYLCLALLTLGRYDEALAAGLVAEQGATEAGDRAALTFIDYEMAYLHLLTGKLDEGLARCDRGLARLGPDSGELWIRGFLYLLKGLALYLTGEHAASTAAFGRGLAMKHDVGDAMGTGYALEGIALLAAAAGRHTRVAWLLGAAGEIWQSVGSRLGRDPFLKALHQQADRGARDALGDAQFGALYRRGAGTPLDQIVALAAAGADDLAGSRVPGRLTGREREIAGLIAEGLSNREVALRLVISKRTVDPHVEHIFAKLGVSSRVKLATWLTTGSGIGSGTSGG
jgi:predicted ATPase/DNA-binding CsgD family transcriptional regulator